MKHYLSKYKHFLVSIAMFIMYFVSAYTYIRIWQNSYPMTTFPDRGDFVVILIYISLYLLCVSVFKANKIGTLRFNEIIYSNLLSIFIVNFITYLQLCTIAAKVLTFIPMIYISVIQIIVIIIGCFISNKLYFVFREVRDILFISSNIYLDSQILLKMYKIHEKYKIKKVIKEDLNKEEIYEQINKFNSILITNIDAKLKKDILEYCFEKGKRVYIIPNVYEIILWSSYQTQIFDTPMLMCQIKLPSNEQLIVKRIIDIILSIVGLITLAPFMILTAILIKLYDGGSIFYKQERCTLNEKKFNVLKFRSMVVDAEKNGAQKSTKNDSRITPIGKLIRTIRLDETPQIINILKGDMSIVGPRPERLENIQEYIETYPQFKLRLNVKAGLTGYAQIYGKYNTSPKDKLHLDLLYIQRFSIINDLKIIMATVKVLFMPTSTEGFQEIDDVKNNSEKNQ